MSNREKTAREMAFLQGQMDKLPPAPTSEEILRKEIPPVSWVVPELIPQGVTILAGAPKLGKSYLVLAIAWAISVGGRVLGSIKVEMAEVLYLALEDNDRRLKARLSKIADHGSGKLYLPTTWRRGAEGIVSLEAWMLRHPETKVIFVDTLQKLAGVEDFNSYRETYDSMARIKEVSDRYNIGVLVVHHTKKAQPGDKRHDWLGDLSGSVGISGAADTIIKMARARGQSDGVLSVTGRDVVEREFPIRFDPAAGTWTIVSEEEEDRADPKRKAAGG